LDPHPYFLFLNKISRKPEQIDVKNNQIYSQRCFANRGDFVYRFVNIIEVPNLPLLKYADIHLVPDEEKDLMDIRIWWNAKMVHSVSLPLQGFSVHF